MRVSSKLSPVINIEDSCNIESVIENSYEYFKSVLMDKDKRPVLLSKFVFIKFNFWIEHKAEAFWHLISLDKVENFGVFPCENFISESICKKNCKTKTRQVTLENKQVRDVCVYRATRINWIADIINLANIGDNSIKKWINDNKLHIRFQHEDVDYVLIFEIHSNKYQLITAFPVFYINKKEQFDNDYKTYLKIKNQ